MGIGRRGHGVFVSSSCGDIDTGPDRTCDSGKYCVLFDLESNLDCDAYLQRVDVDVSARFGGECKIVRKSCEKEKRFT